MSPIKKSARVAGLLYLLVSLFGPFSLMYVPGKMIVPGDATATADHVRASETLLRLGVAGELIGTVGFMFVVFALYRLFKGVDQQQAALMVTLFVVSVPISLFNVLSDIAALMLAGKDHFLSAFGRGQLDALVLLCIRLHNQGFFVAMIFWGLWLVPFGLLVIRSGFIPRVFGILLFFACCGNLARAFSVLVAPQYAPFVSQFASILQLGELPIIFWLLIWGAREPKVRPSAEQPALA
jgi:uncharacterized protein DUF4386